MQASTTRRGAQQRQSYVLLPPRRGAHDKTCFAQLTPCRPVRCKFTSLCPQLAPGFSVGPALYLAHCPASLVA